MPWPKFVHRIGPGIGNQIVLQWSSYVSSIYLFFIDHHINIFMFPISLLQGIPKTLDPLKKNPKTKRGSAESS